MLGEMKGNGTHCSAFSPGVMEVLLRHFAYCLDIIGICKNSEDASKIIVKSNNREVSKRNIYLMDTSGKMVCATLWGEDVSTFLEQSSAPSCLVH